ncbi:cob(I)yrinic acid a,c-diamide adenosyltransferase [Parvularcula sp. LCG005]|uniref:cob(I)yrinic acid a,c-diamide adenosyltransferase n=1 Tax=Parvularcula sp. LCG005 TaxID=3078805 RepID=UPI0029435D34|nr:cob(I)yrinic acid a,c-diamide adenosyltransferase [Parvularcula sp. LCG005]WOI52094.1 cob(I)yrinic acid a,c-diamide adenosyltransferase [Parvularcula sp. LCG005]
MVTLNKIYTRTGDKGTTGVVTGERLSKTHPRIVAIGEVDELNAAVGVAFAAVQHNSVKGALLAIQNDLFDVGADLATPATLKGELRLSANRIQKLEQAIDELNEDLPALQSFVLPSGPGGAGLIHLARAMARRAERQVWSIVELDDGSFVNPDVPRYLNRLSDYLFVAARTVSREAGGEVLWVPGGGDEPQAQH